MKEFEIWPGSYIVGDVQDVFPDKIDIVDSLSFNPSHPKSYNEGLYAFDGGERYLVFNTNSSTVTDNLGNTFECPSMRVGIRLSSSQNSTFELEYTEYGGVTDGVFEVGHYSINL